MATPTSIATVLSGVGDAFDLVGTIITQITAEPLLLFLLAAALIPIGVWVFQLLKGASRK